MKGSELYDEDQSKMTFYAKQAESLAYDATAMLSQIPPPEGLKPKWCMKPSKALITAFKDAIGAWEGNLRDLIERREQFEREARRVAKKRAARVGRDEEIAKPTAP